MNSKNKVFIKDSHEDDCRKAHRENRSLIIRVEIKCISVKRYVQNKSKNVVC